MRWRCRAQRVIRYLGVWWVVGGCRCATVVASSCCDRKLLLTFSTPPMRLMLDNDDERGRDLILLFQWEIACVWQWLLLFLPAGRSALNRDSSVVMFHLLAVTGQYSLCSTTRQVSIEWQDMGWRQSPQALIIMLLPAGGGGGLIGILSAVLNMLSWWQWIGRHECAYRKESGCVGFVILRYHAMNEAMERAVSAPIVGCTTSHGTNPAK